MDINDKSTKNKYACSKQANLLTPSVTLPYILNLNYLTFHLLVTKGMQRARKCLTCGTVFQYISEELMIEQKQVQSISESGTFRHRLCITWSWLVLKRVLHLTLAMLLCTESLSLLIVIFPYNIRHVRYANYLMYN